MQIDIKSLETSNESVSCCSENRKELRPSHMHDLCMQVIIPDYDHFFFNPGNSGLIIRCMNYVRSVPAVRSDCTFGPKEQVRAI